MKTRSLKEVFKEEQRLCDRIWYDRHQMLKQKIKDKKILSEAEKSAKMIEKKYGKKNLMPVDDMEWGMICGKLSALRWLLGSEWDDLDS